MADQLIESENRPQWNVLTDAWLDVLTLRAEPLTLAPLDALGRAADIRGIATANPLDLFAAHRFLLTLLYWKAEAAGGTPAVRQSLLSGTVPQAVLNALAAERARFCLFDDKVPFLQDPAARLSKGSKSVASLFAEFSNGTNVAHFHHGDDDGMRLCLPCATMGLMRLIPWTQAGGQGLTPSVHGAPPIAALATGENLAISLGLNLASLAAEAGEPRWTGAFVPSNPKDAIPYLEALTWNPRIVHLRSPQPSAVCWRCGRQSVDAVGPIVYLKNAATKKPVKDHVFDWQDPAAFYDPDKPGATRKSNREAAAFSGDDLRWLRDDPRTARSLLEESSPDPDAWQLVIPCTNPANNKTFDHRMLTLPHLRLEEPRTPAQGSPGTRAIRTTNDGWPWPCSDSAIRDATLYVRTAHRVLSAADWATVASAAYRGMHDVPAAFDIWAGVYWSMRGRVHALPSRPATWLVLKLMAAVPARLREPIRGARETLLGSLPRRQLEVRIAGRRGKFAYPVAPPRGNRLEAELRQAIQANLQRRIPWRIDWGGLCHLLDQLLD